MRKRILSLLLLLLFVLPLFGCDRSSSENPLERNQFSTDLLVPYVERDYFYEVKLVDALDCRSGAKVQVKRDGFVPQPRIYRDPAQNKWLSGVDKTWEYENTSDGRTGELRHHFYHKEEVSHFSITLNDRGEVLSASFHYPEGTTFKNLPGGISEVTKFDTNQERKTEAELRDIAERYLKQFHVDVSGFQCYVEEARTGFLDYIVRYYKEVGEGILSNERIAVYLYETGEFIGFQSSDLGIIPDNSCPFDIHKIRSDVVQRIKKMYQNVPLVEGYTQMQFREEEVTFFLIDGIEPAIYYVAKVQYLNPGDPHEFAPTDGYCFLITT